ncbi:MAG: M23 family metallopeptidase [Thermodesulfobacteriota bacterium]
MLRPASLLLCLLLALGQGLPAAAQDAAVLVLEPPLRCTNGLDCFIQNYVDQDPGPGVRDYACGPLAYDGHAGTDFRPLDPAALRDGAEVLAAAAGVVRAVRDGMDDVGLALSDPSVLEHSGGGNMVVLEHPGGWSTAYAHLRKGSLRVAPKQRVEAGQVLGRVGLSGRTEFPHVELSVRKDGRPADPFRGLAGGPECGPGGSPLWSPAALARLAYAPSALAGAGFASQPPNQPSLPAGGPGPERFSVIAPAVVFWVQTLGLRAGDQMHLRLIGPDGAVLAEHRQDLDRSQAQRLDYVGKRRRVAPWPPGTYTGLYTLSRADASGKRDVALRAARSLEVR